MNVEIKAKPVFAWLDVTLAPGESLVAESDAMSSMTAEIDLKTNLNGGIFAALAKKLFGGESLFINTFTNKTSLPARLTISQSTPGDVECKELNGESYCFEKGAFIACEPGVKLGLRYAGLGSLIAREGLFKLVVSGHGKVWFGGYGGLIKKEIQGEYIVDTGHLVAYEPHMKIIPKLSNGIIGSITSGEGLVSKITGSGTIYLQTRNLSGLSSWINRHLY